MLDGQKEGVKEMHFCSLKTDINKLSENRGYISRLKQVTVTFFYMISMSILIACAPAEDNSITTNSSPTTGDKSKSPSVVINSASWNVNSQLLLAGGIYSPAQDGSALETDSIIITDVERPNAILGTVQVSLNGSEDVTWNIEIPNLTVIPCQISAAVGEASVTSNVANTDGICGTIGNPPSANIKPVAIIAPSENQAIAQGTSISFKGDASSDADGNLPLSYAWVFGGGTPAVSVGPNPAVQYNSAGSFSATLTVTDNRGLASLPTSVTVDVSPTVVNQQPISVIASTPSADATGTITVIKDDSVTYNGSASSDPDGNVPLTYNWQFSNGSSANSDVKTPPAVQYNTVGKFQTTLVVTDSLGLASKLTRVDVNVVETTVNIPPTAIITAVPKVDALGNINIASGDSINFSGIKSYDPDKNNPLSYAWILSGGVFVDPNVVEPGNVLFATKGNYQAKLTVKDSLGLSSTETSVNIIVTDAPPVGKNKTVSLVVLNDLHAHLTSHVDVKRTANNTSVATKRGGVARIATEIKRIRAENPATAFMNIGDTFHGGVEAFYTEGNDIVTVVNMLGIDVGVPGNWDFAYGPSATRNRFTGAGIAGNTIEQPNYPNLAANVKNIGFSLIYGEEFLQPTFSMNLDGVEVGFIGITSDIVPLMHPSLAIGMEFTQGEDNYRVRINELAAGLRNKPNPAQVVVVMSELGIHKDKQLADVIDSGLVDVFFSAHTHELTEAPLPSKSGALVVEAGNDTYLGRMDIELDQNNLIVARNWKIIPVELSIAEDSAVKAQIDSLRAKYLVANPNLTNPSPSSAQTLTQSIDTVLVTTPNMIERHHVLENPFNNLLIDMMRKEGATDVAFSRGFRFSSFIPGTDSLVYEDTATTVATGELTIEDVYRFIPVPYTLSTANVTVARLKAIIEQNLTEVFSKDRFLHVGGWFDGYSGLSFDLDLAKPDGQRLLGLSLINVDGTLTPLNDDAQTLSITGCTRPFDSDTSALCAYTGFTNVIALLNADGVAYTAIDFLIYALQKPTIFDSNSLLRRDITDSNDTQFWPAVEFVQPINGVP